MGGRVPPGFPLRNGCAGDDCPGRGHGPAAPATVAGDDLPAPRRGWRGGDPWGRRAWDARRHDPVFCVETLAERIARDGPLNELDAVGWILRLARRIEVMHALGAAHGSITPACFTTESVDRNGRAALVDVRKARSQLAYQSPEQVRGDVASVRDDVWGLGATLYAALTGGAPFSAGSDDELRQKILSHSPAPLAVFDVGDDELQRILDSALAREPADRPATVAALRGELERWHPDPAARRLPPIDDAEEQTGHDEIRDEETSDMDGATMLRPALLEDEEDARTLLREAPSLLEMLSEQNKPARTAPAAAPAARAPAEEAPVGTMQIPATAPSQPRVVAPPVPLPPPAAPPVVVAPAPAPDFDDDDEDDVRTRLRSSPFEELREIEARLAKAQAAAPLPVPLPAAPVVQPPMGSGRPPIDDDDSEDDIRTVMRDAPSELLARGPARLDPLGATLPGDMLAPAPAPPAPLGAFAPRPAAGMPAPGVPAAMAPQAAFPPPNQVGAFPPVPPPQAPFGPGAPPGQPPTAGEPTAVFPASAMLGPAWSPVATVPPGSGPVSSQPYSAPMSGPMPPAPGPIGPGYVPRGTLPAQPGSSLGLAIVVAILALLVAAGATFLFLRSRQSQGTGPRDDGSRVAAVAERLKAD